jgi:hypothetical protein
VVLRARSLRFFFEQRFDAGFARGVRDLEQTDPMMLAHSALVTQKFYDVQILKLAKGDETHDA